MTEITADYFAPSVKEFDLAVRIAERRLDNCFFSEELSYGLCKDLLTTFKDIEFNRGDFRFWARQFYHTTDEQTAYWAASDLIATTKAIEKVLTKALDLLVDEILPKQLDPLSDEIERDNLVGFGSAVDEITRLGETLRAQLTESQEELDAILTYQWQNRHSS